VDGVNAETSKFISLTINSAALAVKGSARPRVATDIRDIEDGIRRGWRGPS